jgi:tetratricopeptide (TPR) repeat protein
MTEPELHDKITSYVRDEMSATERIDFELRLQDEPELQALVSDYQMANLVTERMAQKSLQTDFARWRDEIDNARTTDKKSPSAQPRLLIGLAILLGLCGIGWYLMQNQREKESIPGNRKEPDAIKVDTPAQRQLETPVVKKEDKPNDDYATSEPKNSVLKKGWESQLNQIAKTQHDLAMQETLMDRGSTRSLDPETQLTIAKSQIKNKEYKAALISLSQFTPQDPNYLEILMLMGNAYFSLANYKEAVSAYQDCLSLDPKNDLTEYYLLLTYLASLPERKEEAISLSQKILSDKNHTYYTHVVGMSLPW